MTWNSLTDSLRDPSLSIDSFRRQLKTFLCDNSTVCIQRIRDIFVDALYKSTFYLLTYATTSKNNTLDPINCKKTIFLLITFIIIESKQNGDDMI